jgi:RNA polymerase primary sigma factor
MARNRGSRSKRERVVEDETSFSAPQAALLRHRVLSHEEQVELAKRVAQGDERARREMVAANMRLVFHWAKRYQSMAEMDDLIQEGTLGLIRAVDKFEWERGFKFSTYATWWIRQALQRAVEKNQSAGVSLDQPVGEDETTTLGELAAGEDPGYEQRVETELDREAVRKALSNLPEDQRKVVTLRFGLDGGAPASLEEIARKLGLGIRRVRRIEREALGKLRQFPELAQLKPELQKSA